MNGLTLLSLALLIGASLATHGGRIMKPAGATTYPRLPAPPPPPPVSPVYAYPPPPSPSELAAAYRLYALKYGYASAAFPPAPISYAPVAPVTYAAPLPPAYWPTYAPLPPPSAAAAAAAAAHAHHFIDQHFDYSLKHAHQHY